MTISTKVIDLDNTEFKSIQQYAENTKGVWMNMLNAVAYNPTDNKYHFPPIKYSDVNLEGEKIKFASGQEFTVIFSCLASEFANKKKVKDAWWKKAKELVEAYKEQIKLDSYIASNNVDLKKLRKEGLLEDKKDD